MTDYFMDIKTATFGGTAVPNDSTVHFASDGQGGLTAATSVVAGTTFTATATGGSALSVAGLTAGTNYYAFTSDGFYARATAISTTAFTVDVWKHQVYARVGRIPTGTITIHTQCIASEFLLTELRSLNIQGNITGPTNLSITDPIGTVLRGFTIPTAALPNFIDLGPEGMEIRGPVGIIVGTLSQLNATLSFQLKKPVFGGAVLGRVI